MLPVCWDFICAAMSTQLFYGFRNLNSSPNAYVASVSPIELSLQPWIFGSNNFFSALDGLAVRAALTAAREQMTSEPENRDQPSGITSRFL